MSIAKLYGEGKRQILIARKRSEDGFERPEVRIYYTARNPRFDTCSVARTFPDTPVGAMAQRMYFDSLDEERARRIIERVEE
jgi:hypothetical protein